MIRLKAINCVADRAKFNALNTKVQAYSVSHDRRYKAVRWSNEFINPVTGDIAFLIKGRVISGLTPYEQAEVITLDKTWFTTDPIH